MNDAQYFAESIESTFDCLHREFGFTHAEAIGVLTVLANKLAIQSR